MGACGHLIAGLLGLATSVWLLACASPVANDALTVAVTTDMRGVSPLLAFNVTGIMMQRHIYDSLVCFGPDGTIEPRLAVSWQLVDDRTWRFALRKGVKFHDGRPLTAADVKFTLEWLLDPSNHWNFKSYFASYDRIETPDDYTVDIKTTTPDPLLPNVLAAFVSIVPKRASAERPTGTSQEQAIGTGPFKFVSWEPNDRLTLKANPDWYLPPPKVNTLVFRIIPDMGALIAELQAGSVDIITDVPPFMVAALEKDERLNVQTVTSLRSMHMIFDTMKIPELRDTRVRQALNYAVDKEAIIRGVLHGMGTPLGTHVPARIAERIGPVIKPYPHDPQKARALLKAAGYPNGFSLNLYTPNGRYPMDRQVTLAVADQLTRVGIKTSVNVLETDTYIRKLIAHDLNGIYLIGMASRDWDITHSLNMLDPGSVLSYHKDDRLWEMVKKTKATLDATERAAAAYQVEQTVHDDAVYLYLYNVMGIYASSTRAKDFRAPSDEMMDLWNVRLAPGGRATGEPSHERNHAVRSAAVLRAVVRATGAGSRLSVGRRRPVRPLGAAGRRQRRVGEYRGLFPLHGEAQPVPAASRGPGRRLVRDGR